MLRPIGNPLPLGFLALAGGTLLVSGLQLGWLVPSDGQAVGLILIAFVFPLQLLASVFGYLARDVVAGVVGLFLCGLAIYASLAMAVEDARRSTILPLGRMGAGRESVGGNLDEQIEYIEREAGVREQL